MHEGPFGRDPGSSLNLLKGRTSLKTEKAEKVEGSATILMGTLGALWRTLLVSKQCRSDNGCHPQGAVQPTCERLQWWASDWILMHFSPLWGNSVIENTYVLLTWCSQPFLLMGSNSTPMKPSTSSSGCLPHNCPSAFCYFLTSLLSLPFPLKTSQLHPSIWHDLSVCSLPPGIPTSVVKSSGMGWNRHWLNPGSVLLMLWPETSFLICVIGIRVSTYILARIK